MNKYVDFYGIFRNVEDGANTVYLKYKENDSNTFKYIQYKENEEDGYRSSGEVIYPITAPTSSRFNLDHLPIETRLVEVSLEDTLNKLTSFKGHLIIFRGREIGRFGTSDFNDYYPCFEDSFDIELLNLALLIKEGSVK